MKSIILGLLVLPTLLLAIALAKEWVARWFAERAARRAADTIPELKRDSRGWASFESYRDHCFKRGCGLAANDSLAPDEMEATVDSYRSTVVITGKTGTEP